MLQSKIQHPIKTQLRKLQSSLQDANWLSTLHQEEIQQLWPTLGQVVLYIHKNCLTCDELAVLHETVEHARTVIEKTSSSDFQAYCCAIEQLNHRFHKLDKPLLRDICQLLQLLMHLNQQLTEVRQTNQEQIMLQLQQMKKQTGNLVEAISKKNIDSLKKQIDKLKIENQNLKDKSGHTLKFNIAQEIQRLQLELRTLHEELDEVRQKEIKNQAEIGRLNIILQEYEKQQAVSRRQLDNLVARVNFRKKSTNQERQAMSEQYMRNRIRELEEEVEVFKEINNIYGQNQKYLENKIQIFKINEKRKGKANVELQIKDLNQELSTNPDKANGDVKKLVADLVAAKQQYLERLKKPDIIEQMLKDDDPFDDRVVSHIEKKRLEDQNRRLLELWDQAQVAMKHLEKKVKKLQKNQNDRNRLVNHLQRQNLQLSRRMPEVETEKGQKIKNQQTNPKEVQDLRKRVKYLEEQNRIFEAALQKRILQSRSLECQAKLQQAMKRIKELETSKLVRTPKS